jgi:hypothetical protein
MKKLLILSLLAAASAPAASPTWSEGTFGKLTVTGSAVLPTQTTYAGTLLSTLLDAKAPASRLAGSGTVTVTGAASVSGANTGDQTITITGDGSGSGTGSVPLTIVASSTTTAGKVRIANNAETSLGSSGTTAVSPNALSQWWASVKAATQTFSQLSLSGTAAPSDAAVLSRGEMDARYSGRMVTAAANVTAGDWVEIAELRGSRVIGDTIFLGTFAAGGTRQWHGCITYAGTGGYSGDNAKLKIFGDNLGTPSITAVRFRENTAAGLQKIDVQMAATVSPLNFRAISTAGNTTILATPVVNPDTTGYGTIVTVAVSETAEVSSTGMDLGGNLSVAGNATLGDASGDTLTINAGTVTAANATGTGANDIAKMSVHDARFVRRVVSSGTAASVVNNSTTLTNIPGLSAALAAPGGTLVRVSAFATITVPSGVAGAKVKLNFDFLGSLPLGVVYRVNNGSGGPLTQSYAVTSEVSIPPNTGATIYTFRWDTTLRVSSGGSLTATMQAAQNTLDASDLAADAEIVIERLE